MYRLAASAVTLSTTFGLLLTSIHLWVEEADALGFLYAVSRALPLFGAAVLHQFWISPQTLWLLCLLVGTSGLFDFAIGICSQEPVHVAVPLVTSLITLASAIPLTARQFLESEST